MRALIQTLLCCLGLFTLETQPLVLPLPTRTLRDRLSFLRVSRLPDSSPPLVMPTVSDLPVAANNNIALGYVWKARRLKGPRPELSNLLPDQNHHRGEELHGQRASRGRRHVNGGGGRSHVQLLRVGCVLGTCQVQNLSHRLYQLIGQSGREDSAPVNPRSPHSYG